MKKKILIAILVIIVIVAIYIGYLVYLDFQQEDRLREEFLEINELVNSQTIDIDTLNDRLDRIVTTGDYAIVEDAFKSYLRESFDNNIQIANILEDEKIVTLLTAENYKEDGKDFVESKNYIVETREKLEECKKRYSEFLTEEKVMSYINNKGLDSYYIDFYRNEFVGDMGKSEDDGIVESSIDEIISILNTSEEILNLLSENQNDWEIVGKNIVFSNDTISNKYDELIGSLQYEVI